MKKLTTACAAVLTSFSLVALTGISAQAFSPPRVPAPGHVYVSGGANAKMESAITAGITGKAAQTTFQETVKSSPDLLVPDLTQPVKTGGQIGTAKKVFSKAGGAVATLSGVDIVYTMAVGPISKLMGTTTSGDLLCDLSLVVDPSSRCALGAGTGFKTDTDVLLADPDTGVAGGWTFTGRDKYSTWTLTVNPLSGESWSGQGVRCGHTAGGAYTAFRWENAVYRGGNPLAVSTGNQYFPGVGNCIDFTTSGRFTGSALLPLLAPEAGYSDGVGGVTGGVSQGGTGSAWYPKNHPSRGGSSPERHWRADYKCSDGVSKTTKSTSFKETDTVYPPLPSMPCEGGSYAEQVKIWQATADAAAPDLLMYDWVIPTELQTSLQNLPAECRGTASPCTLDLLYVIDSNETVSCFSDPELCVSWYTSANRADQYQCTYGGTVVALKECALFRSTFKSSTTNDVVIGEPETGSGAQTGGSSGNEKPPGGGSTQSGECFPEGWGAFNPIEWVLQPLKCAFIPREEVIQPKIAQTVATVQTKPPFSLMVPVQASIQGFTNGYQAGCSGDIADFDPDQLGRLAIPCEPKLGHWHQVLYAGASVAVVLATMYSIRSLVVSLLNGRGGSGES